MNRPDNEAATTVTEALRTRRSIRAFRPDPVDDATVRELLELAARAPSGGNLQPWSVCVLNGAATEAFRERIRAAREKRPFGDPPEYPVYPEDLPDPFRSRRRDIGEQLYATLGIAREDKAGRLQQFARNFEFFGAPVAMFFTIERFMNANQWAHLGMFMQSLMLAARERGLHTCPQEAWAVWHREIADFCEVPASRMVYCGLALGHADEAAEVNTVYSPRAPLDDFVQFRNEAP